MDANSDAGGGRAKVIAVLGPIRAGKGLTVGTLGLAGLLHSDRIKRIIDKNPAILMQNFKEARSGIGSNFRGPPDLEAKWPNLSPAARLNFCLDPWGKYERLDLSPVGLEHWHKHWGKQVFQIIGQDSYLESQKQLPYERMARDLRDLKDSVNSNPVMPPIIIVEGFEWINREYMPRELLPMIDYMVVIHAPEELIKSRAGDDGRDGNLLWEQEVLPMVKQFGRMFPTQSSPQEDVSNDGIWQSVRNVDYLNLSGLNLQIAHFMGPGTTGEDKLSRATRIGQQILSHVATGGAIWQCYPEANCFDGHGGANVDLNDDNEHPKTRSVDDAKRVCVANGYAGFTYEPSQKRAWWLSSVHDPSQFAPGRFEDRRFEVHVNRSMEFLSDGAA